MAGVLRAVNQPVECAVRHIKEPRLVAVFATFDRGRENLQRIVRNTIQSMTKPNTIALPRVPRLEFSMIGASRSDGDVPSQECALT